MSTVAAWAERPGPVAVLTGAGISTDSGIPDFRGQQGVWTRNPVAELSANYRDYLLNPELRVRTWIARRDNPAWRAEPNAGHRALARLEQSGRSVRILTQNIDRLHQKTGSTPRKVLELHGNMFEVVCVGTSRPTTTSWPPRWCASRSRRPCRAWWTRCPAADWPSGRASGLMDV